MQKKVVVMLSKFLIYQPRRFHIVEGNFNQTTFLKYTRFRTLSWTVWNLSAQQEYEDPDSLSKRRYLHFRPHLTNPAIKSVALKKFTFPNFSSDFFSKAHVNQTTMQASNTYIQSVIIVSTKWCHQFRKKRKKDQTNLGGTRRLYIK